LDVFDTRCKEDMSQIKKQYRKNNLDKVKEAERKSRIKHSDKNKEYQKHPQPAII
jgi:predicted DNA binding CopG/RHH family protein